MEKEKVSNSTGLEQEIQEQAELYAGMQLWMNDGGDEHLFHEHIAKTSFLACAQWMQERENANWRSLREFLYDELVNRREYSASKSFELVLAEMERLQPSPPKD